MLSKRSSKKPADGSMHGWSRCWLLPLCLATAAAQSAYPHHARDANTVTSAGDAIDRRLRHGRFLRRRDGPTSAAARDLSAAAAVDLKIIGGTASSTDKYPYLTSLTYAGSVHLCGGSLVAKDMVLTAAHCAGYTSAIELGRTDRGQRLDPAVAERIAVAYEIKHPGWNPNTVDNDFMLMKLVHPSERAPVVALNTDPNFPSIAGEKLLLMGWGDTNKNPDLNEPSALLLEIELEYVPDATCKAKEGTMDNGDYVSYESRITGNMMCAMDEDGGRGGVTVDEDTCLGDSGGPMIFAGPTNDLQVGVVSWGIGCASQMFPGVYSRVSSQYDWIRESVCEHSGMAPDSFGCDQDQGGGGGFPVEEDDGDGTKAYVTLEVSLDEQPEEFSWMVSTLTGRGDRLVATIPPRFYSGYTNYTFHHKLEVTPNEFHRISLRDSFGDGLDGYVAVYRGNVPILSNLIMYERLFNDEYRTDAKRVDHAFFTGLYPPAYFSLKIKFDKFPKDTWWRLESETDGVILEQRPPGWYNERFELMSIVETIAVFGPRVESVSYRFTIGDSFPCEADPTKTCGDGICCNYGNGEYQLFDGAVEDGDLLSSGGDYGLSYSLLITPPTAW